MAIRSPPDEDEDKLARSIVSPIFFVLFGIAVGIMEALFYTKIIPADIDPEGAPDRVNNSIDIVDATAAAIFLGSLLFRRKFDHPAIEMIEAFTGGMLSIFILSRLFIPFVSCIFTSCPLMDIP